MNFMVRNFKGKYFRDAMIMLSIMLAVFFITEKGISSSGIGLFVRKSIICSLVLYIVQIVVKVVGVVRADNNGVVDKRAGDFNPSADIGIDFLERVEIDIERYVYNGREVNVFGLFGTCRGNLRHNGIVDLLRDSVRLLKRGIDGFARNVDDIVATVAVTALQA